MHVTLAVGMFRLHHLGQLDADNRMGFGS